MSAKTTGLFPAAAALAAILLFTVDCAAWTPPPFGWKPDSGINLGVTGAWVGAGEMGNAGSAGAELTYFHRINAPLYYWLSAGARVWTDGDETGVIPYVETGLSMLYFNLGAGYGPGLASAEIPSHTVNLFVGIAVPIWAPRRGRLFFVEPYYRPAWDVSGGSAPASHEVGLMLKWLFTIGSTGEPSHAMNPG